MKELLVKLKKNLENRGILMTLVIFIVVAVMLSFFYFKETTTKEEEQKRSDYTMPISDIASSSESDNSGRYHTWNAETASFIYFESYEAMEEYFRELEEKREEDLAEYNEAIKGTVVEQLQNIFIPPYLYEEPLAQLQSGRIEVRAPKSDDFPNGELLWLASLEKNTHSFTVGDFNSDGLVDVAHIIGYSGGGTGYFYHLMIFVNDNGNLKYLTDEYMGDRIVIKGMRYESGLFVVDMITQGEGEDFMGYCCPNVPETIKFRLENNQLVEI